MSSAILIVGVIILFMGVFDRKIMKNKIIDCFIFRKFDRLSLDEKSKKWFLITLGFLIVLYSVFLYLAPRTDFNKSIIYLISFLNGCIFVVAAIFNVKFILAIMSLWKLWIYELSNNVTRIFALILGVTLMLIPIIGLINNW